jgi:hypothetical protein
LFGVATTWSLQYHPLSSDCWQRSIWFVGKWRVLEFQEDAEIGSPLERHVLFYLECVRLLFWCAGPALMLFKTLRWLPALTFSTTIHSPKWFCSNSRQCVQVARILRTLECCSRRKATRNGRFAFHVWFRNLEMPWTIDSCRARRSAAAAAATPSE